MAPNRIPAGWRLASYGDVLSETDERAGEQVDLPVLSVTKKRGLMLASERFGKVMHGRDLARYRIARLNQIVADPMLLWDGAIGLQNVVEAGLVSPDYRVYAPSDSLDSSFAGQLMRSPTQQRHYQAGARGTNIRRNRIARADFLSIPILLPPLSEQVQIAAILSAIDNCLSATQLVIEHVQRAANAAMAELLVRGISGKRTTLKNSDIGPIPETWQVVGLLDVVQLPGKLVDPRDPPYSEWPLVAPNHVESSSGRLLAVESAKEQEAISGKYTFEPGDVVYSKIRPYLRKAWLADRTGLCSADMYPLRPHCDKISPNFLLGILLGEHFSKFAESVSMRTGIPKINREELAQYRLALPSLDEQNVIGELFQVLRDRLDAECAYLGGLQDARESLAAALFSGNIRMSPAEEHR